MEICSYVESTQTKKDPKAIAVKNLLVYDMNILGSHIHVLVRYTRHI